MADVKISQLPAATTPLDGTEVLPIVQSATTKQVSIANVTAGRAMSASSLTLTTPLAVTSGGTGLATAAQGSLLSATGADTFSATRTPTLGLAGTAAGTLGLSGSTSGVVTLATQNAAGTWTMKLPTTAGTNNYLLKTDGSGNTDWVNPTALGIDLDVGSTAITGGTTTRILYDNAGVLGEYAVTGTGTTAVLSTSPNLSGNVTVDSATFAPSSPSTNGNLALTGTVAMGSSFLRNRIINGAMQIDQRNAGASVTILSGGVYSVDRWFANATQSSKATIQQSTSVAGTTGQTNSIKFTSSSAYSVVASDFFNVQQAIEGLNAGDLAWGSASAKTITLSFWVYSSLTGTFGGSLRNADNSRSYPFTYTISSASTWEYKTVTIAGDTTGTWATDNTTFVKVGFGLGAGSTYSGTAGAWASANYFSATGAVSVVGTNGATWYVTGVQFEVGSVATPFERRQYGTELMLCQRYYEKSFNQATKPASNTADAAGALVYTTQTTNTQYITAQQTFAVVKRAVPTSITTYNPFAANTGWSASGAGNYTVSVYTYGQGSFNLRNDTIVNAAGTNMSIHWTVDVEL